MIQRFLRGRGRAPARPATWRREGPRRARSSEWPVRAGGSGGDGSEKPAEWQPGREWAQISTVAPRALHVPGHGSRSQPTLPSWDSAITPAARTSIRSSPRAGLSCCKLTPREKQVLELVAQGKDDWAIGKLLSISENTVHWHVERIKKRFGVHTRAQAALIAFNAGEITLGDIRLK